MTDESVEERQLQPDMSEQIELWLSGKQDLPAALKEMIEGARDRVNDFFAFFLVADLRRIVRLHKFVNRADDLLFSEEMLDEAERLIEAGETGDVDFPLVEKKRDAAEATLSTHLLFIRQYLAQQDLPESDSHELATRIRQLSPEKLKVLQGLLQNVEDQKEEGEISVDL